jgi:hypothetical protein
MSEPTAFVLIGRKDGRSTSRRQRRFPDHAAVNRAVTRWRRERFTTWWIFDRPDGRLVAQWRDAEADDERAWTYTRELHQRATREGWGIFNDSEIQRLDDDDANRGFVLPNDDIAITLARAAGVPVKDDGTLDCDELRYEGDAQ